MHVLLETGHKRLQSLANRMRTNRTAGFVDSIDAGVPRRQFTTRGQSKKPTSLARHIS